MKRVDVSKVLNYIIYIIKNVKEPTGQSLQIILNLMLLG